MTNPEDGPRIDLSDVAKEPAEESVALEREVTADDPDDGDTVPTDDAQ